MKNFIIIYIFLFFNNGIAQYYNNYFIIDKGKTLNEKELNEYIFRISKTLKLNMFFIPSKIITRNDSIISIGRLSNVEMNKQKSIYNFLNKDLPYFELEDSNGNKFNKQQFLGKPSLINLWHTQCKPCIKEIPYLNNLKEIYDDKINFIAITFEDKKSIESFLKNYNFSYIILVNAKKHLNKILLNNGYPRIILLDKFGYVKFITIGVSSNDTNQILEETLNIKKELDELISK